MLNEDCYNVSIIRRCAQLKQVTRLAKCEHPERDIIVETTIDGGYIEFCILCDKILDRHNC